MHEIAESTENKARLESIDAKNTKSAKNGIVSFVEGDEQRMMLMGLKRFTKYSHYPNVAALRGNIADKVNKENAYCF